MSAGEMVVDPGRGRLHWKAVTKLHPCWVNKFRMDVCECGVSMNLQQEGKVVCGAIQSTSISCMGVCTKHLVVLNIIKYLH